jgi:hypothetical protein
LGYVTQRRKIWRFKIYDPTKNEPANQKPFYRYKKGKQILSK